jgi:hypothetical protein
MAMKVFAVTDGAAASDVNEYMVNTKWAFKPGATTRNNTTSLANDPDLTLQTDPNKTYWLELIAPFTSIAAAGFKFSFAAPAGSVFTGQFMTVIGGLVSVGVYEPVSALVITSNISTTSSGAGVDDLITVRGSLVTAGTGGGLTYQWAQQTSNGGNTTVRAGSSMYMRRVS